MSSMSPPMPLRRRSPVWALIGLGGALLVLAILAANTGAMALSLRTLLTRPFDDGLWQIWLNVRLPRVLLAVVVGCALACSGAVMQGLFRNPLADPGLLGISSGAALAVALTIVMPLSLPPILALYGHMISAFAGSLGISAIVFTLSRFGHGGLSRLLLAGIAINALCGAAVGVLTYVSDDQQLRQFSLWSMGSLGQAQWPTLAVAASLILPACMATLFMARRLNILQLGEEDAHYLGVNVRRTQLQLLLLSALLVGAAVAVSGVIGFIGLVIPHLLRMRLGADHRWLLPGSAMAGACLLLLADTLARTLVAPAEMPVGLLTSLLGGPYFLWLILRPGVPRNV
ncbi:FecCD family ABC transporter permease [Rahnella selenatireducens]|uniref:FecCD family ABC transporter permease n=1 Tax=Rahnella selenatireducens TaxID=3389797 RepID=UPI003967F3AB